jgi:hypothetical protein
MSEALKPQDPAVVELVARYICIGTGDDPDETFLCATCADRHPMWEAFAADADMLLSALRGAGYQPVKLH